MMKLYRASYSGLFSYVLATDEDEAIAILKREYHSAPTGAGSYSKINWKNHPVSTREIEIDSLSDLLLDSPVITNIGSLLNKKYTLK